MLRWSTLAVTFLAVAQAPTANTWRSLATNDLDSAAALVRGTHPGAHPDMGDTAFRRALRQSLQRARRLLPLVNDAGGYRAVLRRFATGLGDPHLSVAFTAGSPAPAPRWPGFSVRYVDGTFRVATVSTDLVDIRVGDQLMACDGEPMARLARRRLGEYRAVWSLDAEIVRTAFYLLIDDGNPFAPPPRSCVVQRAPGVRRRVALAWQPSDNSTLSGALEQSVTFFGRAELGAAVVDDVYWIGLDRMDARADAMLRALPDDSVSRHRAAAIVIDLRGNGGGSSAKGDSLIAALFGASALSVSRQALSDARGFAWRAAPFVEESLRRFAAERAATYGAASAEARDWSDQADSVARAIERRAPFWPPLPRDRSPTTAGPWRASFFDARARSTVVLTDHVCVSSCLMLVAQLRALGVRHIGGTTSASRRYMEVRRTTLPSGYATFSTLQKVSVGAPDWFGPYRPEVPFPANIAGPGEVPGWARGIAKALAAAAR